MLNRKMTYRFSDTAREDMDDIYDYISFELRNPDAAGAFFDEFERKVEDICKSPKSGHPVSNEYVLRDDVRKLFVKNYIVYYIPDFDNEEILIARVIYGGRDQKELLKEFESM